VLINGVAHTLYSLKVDSVTWAGKMRPGPPSKLRDRIETPRAKEERNDCFKGFECKLFSDWPDSPLGSPI